MHFVYTFVVQIESNERFNRVNEYPKAVHHHLEQLIESDAAEQAFGPITVTVTPTRCANDLEVDTTWIDQAW